MSLLDGSEGFNKLNLCEPSLIDVSSKENDTSYEYRNYN